MAPRIVRGRPSPVKGAFGVAGAIAARPLTGEPLRPLWADARAGQGLPIRARGATGGGSPGHDQRLGAKTGELRVLPNRGGGGRRTSGAFGDALTAGRAQLAADGCSAGSAGAMAGAVISSTRGGSGRGDVLLVPIGGR